MTEKNEKLKPPARRSGRVLGGAAKKSASIPPPPAAELTPEQFAAEQAADQSEGHRPTVGEPQARSAPAPVVGDGLTEGHAETESSVPQGSATAATRPSEEPVKSGPVPEQVSSKPPDVVKAARLESAVGPRGWRCGHRLQRRLRGPRLSPSSRPSMCHRAGRPTASPRPQVWPKPLRLRFVGLVFLLRAVRRSQ